MDEEGRRLAKYPDRTNNAHKTKRPRLFGVMGRLVEQPSPEVCSIKRVTAIRELENGTPVGTYGPMVTAKSHYSNNRVLGEACFRQFVLK
jgi:hypothetical protein